MKRKLKPAEVLNYPDLLECSCKNTDCSWHGLCKECIAMHRYFKTIPNCLEDSSDQVNIDKK